MSSYCGSSTTTRMRTTNFQEDFKSNLSMMDHGITRQCYALRVAGTSHPVPVPWLGWDGMGPGSRNWVWDGPGFYIE
jgi:hypothetical protein